MTTTTTTIATTPDALREARVEAGLTRAQLAAAADCSLAWIANFEQGAAPKRSDVLPRVLSVLKAGSAA